MCWQGRSEEMHRSRVPCERHCCDPSCAELLDVVPNADQNKTKARLVTLDRQKLDFPVLGRVEDSEDLLLQVPPALRFA